MKINLSPSKTCVALLAIATTVLALSLQAEALSNEQPDVIAATEKTEALHAAADKLVAEGSHSRREADKKAKNGDAEGAHKILLGIADKVRHSNRLCADAYRTQAASLGHWKSTIELRSANLRKKGDKRGAHMLSQRAHRLSAVIDNYRKAAKRREDSAKIDDAIVRGVI